MRLHALVIFVIFATFSQNAAASICVDGRIPLLYEYKTSHYVITGKIVKISGYHRKYYNYKGRRNYDEYREINVIVEKIYKGKRTKNILFYDSNDSSRVPAKIGEKWLLFLIREDGGQNLVVNTCGSSMLLSKKSENILEELAKISVSKDIATYRP